MPFALVPFVLLVIPIAEIAAFIAIGGAIGIGWTLLLIVVTAVIGTLLLRHQGFGLIERMRGETAAGRLPGRELMHGAMLLVAGVLLLTPGFVTDALGFLLFVPPVRGAIGRFLAARVSMRVAGGPAGFAFGGGSTGHGPADPFANDRFANDPFADDPFGRARQDGARHGEGAGGRARSGGTIDLDESEYRHAGAPPASDDGAGRGSGAGTAGIGTPAKTATDIDVGNVDAKGRAERDTAERGMGERAAPPPRP